jgi:hypothetical protein
VLALLIGRHLLPDFLLGFTITLGLSIAVVTFQIVRIIRETGWRLAQTTSTGGAHA